MFKKIKQDFEKWLRKIVRDEAAAEVSKIGTSLEAERRAFCNLTKSAECTINLSVARLEQLSHIKEATTLRAHIAEMEAKFTVVLDTIKRLHPTYKV
jgi:hypothetical protein